MPVAKTRICSIGGWRFNCRITKIPPAKTPTINKLITPTRSPCLDHALKAYSKIGKLADKINETQSNRVCSSGITEAIVTVETASTSTETIRKNRNNACHGNHVNKTPEIIGPTASADPITKPAVPITLPRSLCGVIVSSTVWKLGKIIPTATASSNRPIIKTAKLGAQIHKAVPTAKISSIA